MDRFKTIDSFVRVATAGSFSSAAKQLGMSRALVSLHVTDLEKRLGVRLLNRTTRSLTLTEVGASYLEYCQRMLAEMNEQESSITQLQKEPRGSLKVAAPKSFGTLYLSDAVVSFSARYPNIQLSLILEDYSFRAYDFVEQGLDVAVRLGDLPDSTLVARKIATLQWIVCASPKYLRAPRRTEDARRSRQTYLSGACKPRSQRPLLAPAQFRPCDLSQNQRRLFVQQRAGVAQGRPRRPGHWLSAALLHRRRSEDRRFAPALAKLLAAAAPDLRRLSAGGASSRAGAHLRRILGELVWKDGPGEINACRGKEKCSLKAQPRAGSSKRRESFVLELIG